jgi:hypothetical protein
LPTEDSIDYAGLRMDGRESLWLEEGACVTGLLEGRNDYVHGCGKTIEYLPCLGRVRCERKAPLS